MLKHAYEMKELSCSPQEDLIMKEIDSAAKEGKCFCTIYMPVLNHVVQLLADAGYDVSIRTNSTIISWNKAEEGRAGDVDIF